MEEVPCGNWMNLYDDLICGALGYGLGKRNALQQEPRVSNMEIITKFLKSCDIDDI